MFDVLEEFDVIWIVRRIVPLFADALSRRRFAIERIDASAQLRLVQSKELIVNKNEEMKR